MSEPLLIYYAHCLAIYDTPQEARDIELLRSMGFAVINPNNPAIARQCADRRAAIDAWNERIHDHRGAGAKMDPSESVMNTIFKPLVDGCVALAFRATPSGEIPAGVAREIAWASDARKPVIELPSRLTGRVMSIDRTREYLREIGQR